MAEFKYVGQRLPRYDGMRHVTAQTRYVDDIRLPNMLHVKAWRSPVPSAIIKNIDVSQARNLPGVVAVITHEDVPSNQYAAGIPVLAGEEIRYLGQEVAAVAAVDVDTAHEAVALIEVDLEECEPVLDPLKAMEPDSPKVTPQGNLLLIGGQKDHQPVRHGDVEAAFEKADHIVEEYYRTASHEHCPIEPQVSIAQTDTMGRTHIHSVTQSIAFNQGTIASILGVPQSNVHMLAGVVGGGFGGKNNPHTDHICAVLSLYTDGRPVKWRWTREEEFVASTHRGATHMWFKDGVMNDGRVVARKVRSIRDAGAYEMTSEYVVIKAASGIAGPYNIPNVWVDAYAVFTNKRPVSSMRGFGFVQTAFACEVQMDRIARTIGMDPWRLRFINAVRDGDATATGIELHNCSVIEVMQAAAERAGIQLDDDLLRMSSKG